MTRISAIALAAAFLSSIALAPQGAVASGALQRAWVSAAKGADSSGCGQMASPCKTLQYAFNTAALPNGEILIMDPGGYGPLTITNSISIVNDGVGTAGIFSANASGNAIDINMNSPGNVMLKGLTVAAGSSNGIAMKSGGNLSIVNCVVTGHQNNGVIINPQSGTAYYAIQDSIFSFNGGVGVMAAPNFPNVGIASAYGTVRNVVADYNYHGFVAQTTGGAGKSRMIIDDSVAHANINGVYSIAANSEIRLNRVNSTSNAMDLWADGGVISSAGTNQYDSSTGSVSPLVLH